jgi:hypothetical protein
VLIKNLFRPSIAKFKLALVKAAEQLAEHQSKDDLLFRPLDHDALEEPEDVSELDLIKDMKSYIVELGKALIPLLLDKTLFAEFS